MKLKGGLKGGNENEMYGHRSSRQDNVIRVTPLGHKQASEVEAEIDFLQFLKDRGAPVVEIMESNRNRPIEVVPTTDGEDVVACFKWAKGKLVVKEDFSDDLIQKWRRSVGMLHSLTKEFRPMKREE